MAKRIVVVDDEPGVVEELEAWLEDEGYDVETSTDSAQGLKKIRETNPHLVILDIVMPEMDGFEVLSEIKKDSQTADIPVIMLTAKPETRSIMKAKDLRASDYVIKPFKPQEFLRTIQRHI